MDVKCVRYEASCTNLNYNTHDTITMGDSHKYTECSGISLFIPIHTVDATTDDRYLTFAIIGLMHKK